LNQKKFSIFKALSSVSLIIFLGRISGFAREIILSSKGGADQYTDLSIILLNFPDLILNIMIGGGIPITIVPLLEKLKKKDQAIFISQVLFLIAASFSFIALIIYFNKDLFFSLLAPGFNKSINQEILGPLNLTLIAVPFSGMATVSAAVLNYNYKFRLGSSGFLIFNSIIISFLILKIPILWGISFGILIGYISMFIIQILNLKISLNFKEISSKKYINFRILRKLISNFGFASSIVILPVIARSYSSFIDFGSISLFNYSFKLLHLPIGIFIVPLTTVFLTIISKNPSKKTIFNSIKITSIIAICLTFFLIIFTKPIVNLVFFKAAFGEEQFAKLYDLTFYGFIFIWPYAMVSLFGIIIAVWGKSKFQLYIGFFLFLYMLVITPILMSFFGISGVMISYGTSFLFAALIQSMFIFNFRKKNNFKNLILRE